MKLVNTVRSFIIESQLLKHGDRVIVAVSGGPDSVTLLNVLNTLRHDFGISLSVAHINHNLRKNSGKDEHFVKNLADKLNLSFYSTSLHLQKRRGKSSIEELAREARLKFFIRLAKKQRASCVALGHTQDDLAETVLMRILRGTGLFGLRAILPKRTIEEIIFIRPLLEVRRKEIESFLKKHSLKFCRDATNSKPDFFRNKIRLHLLPTLERAYNPNIKKTLAHLSESITADYAYLEKQAQAAWRRVAATPEKGSGRIRIHIDSLKKLDIAIKRIVLRQGLEKFKGDTRQLSFVHMKAIERLLHTQKTAATVHLPNGILVSKYHRYLTFTRVACPK